MSEQELIDLLLKRDPRGMDELLRRFGPLMRYVIAPILSDPREREECLSDVSMRVWERIRQYDSSRGGLAPWLSVLTRNTALNRARGLKQELSLEEVDPNTRSHGDSPEETLLRQERAQLLKRAMAEALSQTELTLFYRKYYYLQSTAQIAAEIGMSERAVEGRLYRIKNKLRERLGGEFCD